MKRLFIAEKPSVAKALAAELPGSAQRAEGYITVGDVTITWCFGHLLEMVKPEGYDERFKSWRTEDLPIIPGQWKLEPKDDAKAQLKVIGQLLKQADEIVNAGDPDREGQLLVDEVLEHFGNTKPVLRFWSSAQDPTSLQRALKSLKPNTEFRGMRDAALARQRADWLVGMNLSRAFTLRARRGGGQSVVSVGRVQTPTLALVVSRDREIENFKPIDYFTIGAEFGHEKGNVKAAWRAKDDQPGLDAEGRLIDAAVADSIVAAVREAGKGVVVEASSEPKSEKQPLGFSLADLQLEASKRFGLGADETLKAAQSLYDTHKLTSYPRTDCPYLPESQHADGADILKALAQMHPDLGSIIAKADPSIRAPIWNDAKITAHHAIIPTTYVKSDLSGLSQNEADVYGLIVRRYLKQWLPEHKYMANTIVIESAGHQFVATGKVVLEPGWRAVYPKGDEEAGESVPLLTRAGELPLIAVDKQATKTKPPARFTEGTLVKAMENIHRFTEDPEVKKLLKDGDGIGTSATRASIISELKRREFLETKGKHIISTPLGRSTIDMLPDAVKSPALTAQFESRMNEIQAGRASVQAFLDEQIAVVRAQVEAANEGAAVLAGAAQAPKCPTCEQGFLSRRTRKDGKGHFWGCSRWKEGCEAIFEDRAGKPVLDQHSCPECKEGTLKRIPKKAGGYFWGCSRFREGCKAGFDDKRGKPDLAGKAASRSSK